MERLVFKNTCCKVVEEENCVESSERCTNMKREAKNLLDAGGNDRKAQVVDSFSKELVSTIRKCLQVPGTCRSVATQCGKAQSNFHKLRVSKLTVLWENFYTQMGMETRDPLLLQSVNQEIFDTLLVQSETSKATSRPPAPL